MNAIDEAKTQGDLVETLFGLMPDPALDGRNAEPTDEEADH